MAIPANMAAALAAIDTATSNLAAVVTSLRAAISTSMTQADVDAVDTKLGEIATSLNGIAADPNNPTPGPTPVPLTKKP